MASLLPSFPDPSGPGTVVRLPSRQEVRALVARQSAELAAAATRGENVHQLSLDQLDLVEQYAAALEQALGEDAAAAFLRLWSEETNASAEHTMRETAALNATLDADALTQATQQAESEQNMQLIGGVIAALVVAVLFALLIV